VKKTHILILLLLTVHCAALSGAAQSPKIGPRAAAQVANDTGSQTPAGVTITPAMKPEDQLRVRNLQYQKDKKLLELQNVVARYNELQASLLRDDQMIEEAVRASANTSGVDTSKYVFDLDSLTWNLRPASAATTTETAPNNNGRKKQ